MMSLAVTRIWCFLIGLIQFLHGAAHVVLPLGQAGLGWAWAIPNVVLPIASGITLVIIGLRGFRSR
ncbi:hypothetical protein BOSE127_170034 [Bosea sp. 127]|nr:hypothetical protein BOSE127_170034 [Bosea sp. 127]